MSVDTNMMGEWVVHNNSVSKTGQTLSVWLRLEEAEPPWLPWAALKFMDTGTFPVASVSKV